MKKILLAIFVLLSAAFAVEVDSDREPSDKEPETPFSICQVLSTCDIED
ncbi:hypothetical protein [Rheinheimera sp.]|nr:hypothetical protein [Rheinheimera sp.]